MKVKVDITNFPPFISPSPLIADCRIVGYKNIKVAIFHNPV